MPLLIYALALAGALGSASATILIRQGLRESNAYAGFWLNLAVGTLGLWVAVWLMAPRETIQATAIPLLHPVRGARHRGRTAAALCQP
jgi:hypothetical protein